jgi:DNA-binding XRE family transcriptional regulator
MVNNGGHKLVKYRVSKRATLEAAGAEFGVTRQCWFDWERGKRMPSRDLMLRLCASIPGLSPNDFYDLPAPSLACPLQPQPESRAA